MLICVCQEHLERALDEYTEEHEVAPSIFLRVQLEREGKEVATQCSYCQKESFYVVKGNAD